MMISAQISIQIISARGPPLIIALKDVHKLEKQAEEPSFCLCVCVCLQEMCKCPPPLTQT